MQRKTNYFAVGLIVASFLLSLNLGINSASAASATITTNTDITLNASSAGNGVSIDEESIGITTTCNKGYNLTIATSTSTDLYLNGDSTKTAAFAAVDGTSALDSTNNTNKWGYTLTNDATASTVFSPLSTTASSIRTISQTNNVTSETIPIYYGIKTDSTIDPGTYTMGNNGTVVYYLTMNPLCNVVDIAYDGNNADAGTMGAAGTGVIHTGKKDGDTIDLIASNFSRDGYGFAGWSTDKDAGTKLLDNDNTNNPVVYGPQESITLPEGFANNDTDNDGIVKLYAVWLQSQGNLQGWMGCSNLDTATYDSATGALDLTKNSVTALTDMRDHDTYAVARLADGKCWMIENLRLEAEDTRTPEKQALAQGYGGQFTGLADAELAWADRITTANSLYSTDGANDTINIGTSDASYRFPRYNNINTPTNTADRPQNPTTNGATNSTSNASMYSYGNYYTWAAAIADTTNYDSGDHNTTSICPAGWQLPLGNTSTGDIAQGATDTANRVGGFSYLDRKMGGTGASQSTAAASLRWRKYPVNFVYSGGVSGGSVGTRGSYGCFWSTTMYLPGNAYSLYLYSSYAGPNAVVGGKYSGWTVRCVASDPQTYTLSYDANGGTGAPASQTTTANGIAHFTLNNTTPTRSGYTFAGWTDEKGNEAQPSGTFTTKDPNATLYAIWTNNSCNPTATTIGTGNTTTDAVCLQDITPSMKSSLPTADATTGTYTLIDARDSQSYTIAKLPDGNLWMTKNLNYSSTTMNTSHDTDTSTTFRLPESTTTSNTSNTTASIRTTNNSGNNDNGTYYSWPAAIASTASYNSGNVASSICPKGWDLPPSNAYTNLKTQADYKTGNLTTSAPSSFLINGGFTNGASFYQTSYSHFWTSTVNNASTAYGAIVDGTDMTTSSSTSATYGGNKYYRKNIRCIASNGTVTINYEGNGTTEYPVTGSVASQIDVEIGTTKTRPGSGFARNEWLFLGWNTLPDGTGIAIAANTVISSLNPTPDSTITLYAQWKHNYSIQYDGNGASNTNGMGTLDSSTGVKSVKQTNVGEGDPVTLLASNFKKAGYGFAGWSTNPNATVTSGDKIYGPMETISAPAYPTNGTNIITMYAVWVPAEKNGDNPVYLQDFTVSDCNALTSASFNTTTGEITPGSIIALTDKRDDEVYTIAKLADNNCWMIENLRLEHEGTVGNNKNDSSVTNQSLSQGYGGTTGTYGNFVGLANPESAKFSNSTTSNSIYKSSLASPTDTYNPSTGTLEDIGNSNYPGYRFPRYNSNNTQNLIDSTTYTQNYANASSPSDSGTNYRTSSNIYGYGNYYNWAAAMANTNYYTDSSTSEAAGTSICPSNWHLPSSDGTTKEYGALSTSYGGTGSNQSGTGTGDIMSNRFRSFPNNFLYSGDFRGSSAYDRGSSGHYWSRSAYSHFNLYILSLDSTYLNPSYGSNKYLGFSVRCLIGS